MRVKWDEGEIRRNLDRLDRKTADGIRNAFDFQAARSVGYMKSAAPWTDQTSAARAGLHTNTTHIRSRSELILSHAVSYGIYLEVCNNGRYAIILPALRRAMDELTSLIDGMWGRR